MGFRVRHAFHHRLSPLRRSRLCVGIDERFTETVYRTFADSFHDYPPIFLVTKLFGFFTKQLRNTFVHNVCRTRVTCSKKFNLLILNVREHSKRVLNVIIRIVLNAPSFPIFLRPVKGRTFFFFLVSIIHFLLVYKEISIIIMSPEYNSYTLHCDRVVETRVSVDEVMGLIRRVVD